MNVGVTGKLEQKQEWEVPGEEPLVSVAELMAMLHKSEYVGLCTGPSEKLGAPDVQVELQKGLCEADPSLWPAKQQIVYVGYCWPAEAAAAQIN